MKKSFCTLVAGFLAVLAAAGFANAKFYGNTSGEAYIPMFHVAGLYSVKGNTCFHITNVTDQNVTVSIALYTPSGNILKDAGGSPSTGFILAPTAYSGSYTNYTEEPVSGKTVEFVIPGGQQVLIQLMNNTSMDQFGFGKVSWTSSMEVDKALMVQGYQTYNGTATATQSMFYIPVNEGKPF